MAIDWDWDFPVRAAWDDGCSAFAFKVLPDEIGVIALIGDDNFRRGAAFHDRAVAFVIGNLAAC